MEKIVQMVELRCLDGQADVLAMGGLRTRGAYYQVMAAIRMYDHFWD